MTSLDNFNLLCKEFGDSVCSTFKKLREDTDFTDVTLVSEDRQQIEAHKVILSSSSLLFRDMLKKMNHSHPMIFLRGIKSKYLISILDFIYRGEVNILQEDIADFFAVAENLEIRLLQAETRDKDFQRIKEKQKNIDSKENQITDSLTNIMDDSDSMNNTLKESGKDNAIAKTVKGENTFYQSQNNYSIDDSDHYNRTMMTESLSGTQCPQCGDYICGATKLKAHIAHKHFTKEIKKRYILSNSRKCPIEECEKEFQMNFRLIRHIGSTHNKVQEILSEKGIEVPDMLLVKNGSILK